MPEKCANEQKRKLKELKEYLKTIPPPPPEHTNELRMEKKLKRIIKEEEKQTQLNRSKNAD